MSENGKNIWNILGNKKKGFENKFLVDNEQLQSQLCAYEDEITRVPLRKSL